jgi:hypothetical protein
MSRDASGNYTLPAGNPVVTATVISSTWANSTLNDIKDALTDSLSRTGNGGMTAPLAGVNGTALIPAYTFSTEPTLGFYKAAAGVLASTGPLQLPGSVTQPLQAVPLQQLTNYQPTFRNAVINGDFSVWQRGTTQSTSGYASDDRWTNSHVGDLKTASQGTFTLGQTAVPGNPKFFSNTIFAPNVGAGNYVAKQHRIEGVRNFSGKNVRLSFWAKALSAPVPIAIDLAQGFGTGGSPSAAVTGIGAQKFNLTTSWQKFTATVAIPSIAGKTLGTSGTDGLELSFWFSAGSDYNSRTATLGQQSGEVQLALVQLEEGTVETTFEFLPPSVMLALCQRYYEEIAIVAITTSIYMPAFYKVTKRATPNLSVKSGGLAGATLNVGLSPTVSFRQETASGANTDATIAADAEL